MEKDGWMYLLINISISLVQSLEQILMYLLKPIVVGSHIDTVPTGGKYDGVLGVLGGMEALKKTEGKY